MGRGRKTANLIRLAFSSACPKKPLEPIVVRRSDWKSRIHSRRLTRRAPMARTVADLLAQTLADVGVKRIWGVTGDSLNGLTDSLHRLGQIAWLHGRHEEVPPFARGAIASVDRGL